MRIHHFGIRVKDVDATLKFYNEILGLEIKEIVNINGQNFYFVGDGTGCLEIEQAYQVGNRSFDNGFSHIALEVEDLEAYCRKLKDYSVHFLLEPSQFRPDRKIAFIEDLEGNAIQLIEFLEAK